MSNVIPFQTEEQMYDDASAWIAKLDRGLSDEETRSLKAWLKEHPRHEECFLELAELWDGMDSLSVLSELFDPPVRSARGKWFGIGAVSAIAASALFVALALGLVAPLTQWEEPGADAGEKGIVSAKANTVYETGVGVHSSVNLPDGTVLLLNTDTLVSVTYSDEERLLELKRGELHVEVAHEPSRPLRVKAGDKLVEAVGTAFNVYLLDDKDFDVIVTEGRVKVRAIPVNNDSALAEDIRELTKGQKLSVRAKQLKAVEPVNEQKIQDRLSWRQGNLVFRGETLQSALDEVSRYTSLDFEVADQRIAEVRIAGLYKTGDIEGLLLALKENFNIEHQRTKDGTILLRLKDDSA